MTHVTALDGVHGQQVIAVSQLETHKALGSPQGTQLLHGPPAGPRQLLQQQCVLAHALDRLQQVGGQVQVVPQHLLLVLPGGLDTIRRLQGTPAFPPTSTVSGSPTLKKA